VTGKGNIQKQGNFFIGLGFSGICLYLAFRGIQFNELFNSLTMLDYYWVVLATVLLFASYSGRVWRWHLLFFPQKVHLVKVFQVLNIGYLLSAIFPLRLGDVARVYLIGSIENISKARALSSIVIERLSDGLTVVLLLAITSLFAPNIPNEVRKGAFVIAIMGLSGFVLMLLLSFQKDRGLQLLRRMSAPIPFLEHTGLWKTLESFIDGLAVLRSPYQVIGIAVWSLYTWVIGGLMYWVMMYAMGLALPLTAAFLVLAFTSLVAVVPSSPGYVGIFHYAAQIALVNVFGVDNTSALSYAVVVHAFTYLWLVGLGVYSMWREGLTFQQLRNRCTK